MREAKGKREIEMLKSAHRRWEQSTDTELYHVYGKASDRKYAAMNYCKSLMRELGGWDLRILSYNTMQFTVGFEFPDAETGEVKFAYITKAYDRCVTV